MNIEENIFKKAKVNFSKLIEYGFIKEIDNYIYSKILNNNKFKVEIIINKEGSVNGKVFDLENDEEYTNIKTSMQGNFVSSIRDEYINILNDIKDNCFIELPFVMEQSNRLSKKIYDKYKIKAEFLWEKFPTYGVFRNKNSDKWFGIIMLLDKYKLNQKEHKEIEIMNVKLDEDKVKELLKRDGFYKAYHIRSNAWVTISLEDIINDEEIMELLDISYKSTYKK